MPLKTPEDSGFASTSFSSFSWLLLSPSTLSLQFTACDVQRLAPASVASPPPAWKYHWIHILPRQEGHRLGAPACCKAVWDSSWRTARVQMAAMNTQGDSPHLQRCLPPVPSGGGNPVRQQTTSPMMEVMERGGHRGKGFSQGVGLGVPKPRPPPPAKSQASAD